MVVSFLHGLNVREGEGANVRWSGAACLSDSNATTRCGGGVESTVYAAGECAGALAAVPVNSYVRPEGGAGRIWCPELAAHGADSGAFVRSSREIPWPGTVHFALDSSTGLRSPPLISIFIRDVAM